MEYRPLLLGASALALVWSGAAAAQTAAEPAQDAPAAASAADAEESEIVVTAQRRSENLMTTAVSASVLSGTQLDNKGVANVDALQFAMPSIVVNNFGQGNDFNIRGIGKAEHNTQTTTGVITYRDGVPTFPDPTSRGGVPKVTPEQVGVSDSVFQAAQRACAQLLQPSQAL